jgi:DNA-binding MarR family transcriptional regulator
MSLGQAQQRVLAAIARLGEDAWKGKIEDDLDRRGLRVGDIKATLLRLRDAGMVERSSESVMTDSGPRYRDFYRLTEAGTKELDQARAGVRGVEGGADA